jgi:hypothetical protein
VSQIISNVTDHCEFVIHWPLTGEQLKLSSPFALEGKVNGGDKEESAGEASPKAADSDHRWI